MSKNYEIIASDSGETLWPVETLVGLRYMRSVDAEVHGRYERENRDEIIRKYVDLLMHDDDPDDPIGELAS